MKKFIIGYGVIMTVVAMVLLINNVYLQDKYDKLEAIWDEYGRTDEEVCITNDYGLFGWTRLNEARDICKTNNGEELYYGWETDNGILWLDYVYKCGDDDEVRTLSLVIANYN